MSREERRRGRAWMLKLLPEARALLTEHRAEARELSAVARAQMRHVTEDNLWYLTLHRGERGGWICDLVLKAVPAGVANSFGTPVERPWPTREEAEASAVRLLAFALAAGRIARELDAADAPRVFEFFGCVVELPEAVLSAMEAVAAANPGVRYGAPERAVLRLDGVADKLFPGARPTAEALNALPLDGRAELLTVCCMAALEGVFRHPPREAEPVGRFPADGRDLAPRRPTRRTGDDRG